MSAASPSALRRLLPHLGFFIILLICSLIYYADTITRLPFGIHEWAQGDRLALALNFYDNGLNFFKPATSNLNSINGIVGVEFPIQSYIAGALGYIFGRGNISACFRIVDILIAWTGLYFLFRIVYNRSKDFILSIVTPLIIFCSPIFVAYSGNYLPDPTAVSIAFIAFFFFFKYVDTRSFRKLVICILILTLAVLVKASTATYWFGILCFGLYTELLVRKSRRHTIMLLGLAVCSVALVFLQIRYINYLNTTYHSYLFLARPRPFTNWHDVEEYIGFPLKEVRMKEYFLLAEYPIMVFIMAMGINILKRTPDLKPLLLPLIVFLPGALVMFSLFGNQLIVHDYYILAIFFPLFAYMLVASMVAIHRRFSPTGLREWRVGLLSALIFTFFLADHQIYNRFNLKFSYDDKYSSYWLYDGALMADSVGVPKKEHILVAGDSPPNLSLVYFDRKGYVMSPEEYDNHIDRATWFLKEKNLRYLVISEASFRDYVSKDTVGLAPYNVLSVGKGKAILKLK